MSSFVYSLVMACGYFKLAEENVSIAKVTVGPPLSGLIPKLFSDEQPLPNRTNHSVHITEVMIYTKHFQVIGKNKAFEILKLDKIKCI